MEILVSSEELAVFGGPASIDVNVDFGPQGQRGTLIFTGNGKPTDPDVDLEFNNEVYNSQSAQPLDLFINLNPEDFEYLFLYQYGYVNGVLQWSKVLRLIPNTALANLDVIFYNGQAVTFTPAPGAPVSATVVAESIDEVIASPTEPPTPSASMVWLNTITGVNGPWELKFYTYIQPLSAFGWVPLGTVSIGLFFPVGDYFDLSNVILPAQGATLTRNKSASFNIQYVILNDTPVSSGLTLGDLTQPATGSKIYLPVNIKAVETGLTGFAQTDVTWQKITGVRKLSIVVTANIGSLPISEEES